MFNGYGLLQDEAQCLREKLAERDEDAILVKLAPETTSELFVNKKWINGDWSYEPATRAQILAAARAIEQASKDGEGK